MASTWIIVDRSYQLSDHAVYQPKQAIGLINPTAVKLHLLIVSY